MTLRVRALALLTVWLGACGLKRLDLGRDRPRDAATPLEAGTLADAAQLDDANVAHDGSTPLDGGDSIPQVEVAASTRLFLQPAASCALASDGYIACFGAGERGQLAIAARYLDTDCAGRACTYAARESNVYQALDVALSEQFGCAAIGDGVFCFGDNRFGQLGRDTRDADPHPEPEYVVRDGWDPQRIAVGFNHACALSSDGRVDCWGVGNHGQLGVDPATLPSCGSVDNATDAARLGLTVGADVRCAQVRSRVPGILDGVAIAAAGDGTCVVRATGELRCFGQNQQGELGLGDIARALKPEPSSLTDVTSVSLSPQHGCAITRDQGVSCWGSDTHRQLALAQPASEACDLGACARTPQRTVLQAVTQLALGARTTFALRRDARVFAVGDDGDGQLGNGKGAPATCAGVPCTQVPIEVPLTPGVFAIAAAGSHACAVLSGNAIQCWGRGSEAQTGNSFLESSDSPVTVDLRVR